jgi:transcriptional regulator with AAA-type ATPase domain
VSKLQRDTAAQVLKKREAVRSVLLKQHFKGNVRELENIARRFCLLFQPERHGESIDTLLEACLENRMVSRNPEESPIELKTALEVTEKNILLDMTTRYKNIGGTRTLCR